MNVTVMLYIKFQRRVFFKTMLKWRSKNRFLEPTQKKLFLLVLFENNLKKTYKFQNLVFKNK